MAPQLQQYTSSGLTLLALLFVHLKNEDELVFIWNTASWVPHVLASTLIPRMLLFLPM
jgi:hypothetical protein